MSKNFVYAWQVGYLPQSVAQPERADTFGNPFDDLAFAFMQGWKAEEPCGVVPIDKDWREDSAKLCQEGFNAMMARLKTTPTVNWKLKVSNESVTLAHGTEAQEGKIEWETISGAEVFEKINAILKKHPFKPTHRVYIAYRRSFQLLVALARFVDHGGKPEDFKIPVVERVFKNAFDEKLERRRENTDKHYAKPYSVAGLAYIVSEGITESRWTETDAMRELHLKRGLAQQAYSWALVHREYPTLNVLERLLKPVPAKVGDPKQFPYEKGGWVPMGITPTDLRGVLGLSRGDENLPDNVLAAYKACNALPDKDGKRWANAPTEVVEKLFELAVTGATRRPKGVTEKGVTSLASEFPADNPLNRFLKAVAIGDEESTKRHLTNVKAMVASADDLRKQVETLKSDCERLTQERDSALAERDAAINERDSLKQRTQRASKAQRAK